MTAGREVGGTLRHVEAEAVVAHFQFDFLLPKRDMQVRAFGLRMAHDIIQGFLCHAVERQFHFT